jgi:regulator of ribonuclease activity A
MRKETGVKNGQTRMSNDKMPYQQQQERTLHMSYATADLCDQYADQVQVVEPIFRDFGGVIAFHGPIVTVDANEDNSAVRDQLSQPGLGRVLVIDGRGSLRCALLGDQLARLAVQNGWTGVVVNGCVRDAQTLATLPLGVKALAAHPRRSEKRSAGAVNVDVTFAGVTFKPGHMLYADGDGIVVSERELAA